MTRQEYMDALQAQLGFLSPEAKEAALSFCEEMIDDRMEDGMDEASAVAAMEAPADIAARLRTENPAEPTEKNKTRLVLGPQDERMEFSALADSVLRAVEEAARQAEAAVKKAEPVISRVEAAEEAAGETGKDALEKNGEYERKTLTCPAEQLRAVQLLAKDMPVRVEACDGDTATLIYYSSPKDPYVARMENGTLTLSRDEQAMALRGFGISFLSGRIHWMWSQASPTIELHLPADTLTDLSVHTSNGSIRMQGMRQLCDVELQTSNSRIALEDIRCRALDMTSSNGRLALNRVESKRLFRGRTSNARIEATDVIGGETMDLRTSNGRIAAERAAAPQGISLTTSNSSVSVQRLNTPFVTLKTSNGAIRGTLPGPQTDWTIISSTSNGRNSLPQQRMGSRQLTAHTSNGNIDLTFEA